MLRPALLCWACELKIRLRSQARIGVPALEDPETRSYFEFCGKRVRNNFAIANFPDLISSPQGVATSSPSLGITRR